MGQVRGLRPEQMAHFRETKKRRVVKTDRQTDRERSYLEIVKAFEMQHQYRGQRGPAKRSKGMLTATARLRAIGIQLFENNAQGIEYKIACRLSITILYVLEFVTYFAFFEKVIHHIGNGNRTSNGGTALAIQRLGQVDR